MATRIIAVGDVPADLFDGFGAGFGTANTPGFRYDVQNVSGETVRYATAATMPTDLTQGFRLYAGERDTFTVPASGETLWVWCSVGRSARLGLEF